MRRGSRAATPPPTPVCPRMGKLQLTKSQAKSCAKRDEKRSGLPMQAYECGFCEHWHVGKKRGFSSRFAQDFA